MTSYPDTIQATAVQDDPQARALLRAATERSYRLPADFPGFTAALTVEMDAERWTGRMTGRTPQEIRVTLDDETATAAREWAQGELRSIIGHRWPTPFDERDGRYILTLDPTPHPLGVRIDLHNDPLRSYYRVRAEQILMVQRFMGAQSFTITMLAHTHVPDGRTLAAQYVVVFRDTTTFQIAGTDAYNDTFADVAGCWLPTWRRVVRQNQVGVRVSTLTLHDHRLLEREETAL